jgi:hypothetical protein
MGDMGNSSQGGFSAPARDNGRRRASEVSGRRQEPKKDKYDDANDTIVDLDMLEDMEEEGKQVHRSSMCVCLYG